MVVTTVTEMGFKRGWIFSLQDVLSFRIFDKCTQTAIMNLHKQSEVGVVQVEEGRICSLLRLAGDK